MKVMRMAIGRGKSHYDFWDFLNQFNDTIQYPLTPSDYGLRAGKIESMLTNLNKKHDLTTMIPWCRMNNGFQKPDEAGFKYECTLFDPVATDMNICHSFNAKQTIDLMQESQFTKAFMEAYKKDLPKGKRNFYGKGSGEDYSLEFYLMDNHFWRKKTSEPSTFLMGITSESDYFDIKSSSQRIKAGYHTILKVQAMEILPSEDLHDVPIEKRECRFPDEVHDLEIFKVYSQTACEYECRIKKAASVCRCYPWFVPMPPKSMSNPICDLYGNYCFKTIMNEDMAWKNCTCLPSCHQIEFTYYKEMTPLVTEDLCWQQIDAPHKVEMKIVKGGIFGYGFNSLVYRYYKYKGWLPSNSNDTLGSDEAWDTYANEKKMCVTMLKNHMAKVSVMFDRKKYVRTLTNLRVTFTDKLAAFGKILEKIEGYVFLFVNNF